MPIADPAAPGVSTGGVTDGGLPSDGAAPVGSPEGAAGRDGRPLRVLYLSFFFPPSRASGVFRGRATANHFAQAGWDVTVITAPREFFSHYLEGGSDETLEATVDPRVRVERPPMNTYHWETDIRRFSRLRKSVPVVADRFYRRFQSWFLPEHYIGWVPGLLARAFKLHARRRFDLVVATGNPFVSFAAAWALGRAWRVPYVVDYRDAWTFNQFTEQVRFGPGTRTATWESRVLRDAAEVVFVNDGMRQWYAERYPFAADRMTVVPNGWEPEFIGRPEFRAPDPDRPLRFGYLGTVTPYLPLDILFEGWRRARTDPLMAGAELHVHGHLGFFAQTAESLREQLAQHESVGVRYRGPFGKADVAEVYAETDALVFCVPGAKYVTSGKVFEYMAAGKPVVSVHEPDIAASEVLKGYPLWFAGDRLDADAVAESFVAAAKAAREMDPSRHAAAQDHAAKYTRSATLSPWEARMRKLVEESR
ncbi:glycosyltransferase [Micromonospora phytophila]|uniref:glycosyltransferase n=1 Tax=Micromonospora phytophila TaxID=709888 RepID=UPI00202E3EA4|nr:glycosyltransferase [Micromonospora phytophila]MCM0675563.1 glycosyltransferase [Micromonospora phytophila]